jgi:hypothetical protein
MNNSKNIASNYSGKILSLKLHKNYAETKGILPDLIFAM